MMFILGAIVGGCIGFVMAAIMSNAHELDEQERRKAVEQKPRIEEHKLKPIRLQWSAEREKLTGLTNEQALSIGTSELLYQLAPIIKDKVNIERDFRRMIVNYSVEVFVRE